MVDFKTIDVTKAATYEVDVVGKEMGYQFMNPKTEELVAYEASIKGEDVELKTDAVSYYVTAKATANFTYDGIEYKKDTVYRFEAKELAQSGKEELVKTYQWLGTTTREPKEGETGKVGMVLETGDIAAGAITELNDGGTGVRLGEITVYEVVNNGEAVAIKDHSYDSAAVAYEDTVEAVTVVLKGYVNSGRTDVQVKDEFGNIDHINNTWFETAMNDNNNFVGTRFNEYAYSVAGSNTYDLEGGRNTMYFSGDFGADTVVIEKGEGNIYDLRFVKADGTAYKIKNDHRITKIGG